MLGKNKNGEYTFGMVDVQTIRPMFRLLEVKNGFDNIYNQQVFEPYLLLSVVFEKQVLELELVPPRQVERIVFIDKEDALKYAQNLMKNIVELEIEKLVKQKEDISRKINNLSSQKQITDNQLNKLNQIYKTSIVSTTHPQTPLSQNDPVSKDNKKESSGETDKANNNEEPIHLEFNLDENQLNFLKSLGLDIKNINNLDKIQKEIFPFLKFFLKKE